MRPIARGTEIPARRSALTTGDVGRQVRERCLAPGAAPAGPGAPPERVGVEVEWLVHPAARPADPVPLDRLREAVAGAGPLQSRITYEPGGQLEISAPPRPGAAAACAVAAADLARLTSALDACGLRLTGAGLDPLRPPRRVVDTPRYRAMERYFDAAGPAGRTMMCSTASVQVNVDLGGDAPRRWRLAHRLGPVLAAAFANSPAAGATRAAPWRSTRLSTWSAVDPTRTRPVPARDGDDPAAAWTDYALAARVMLVRHGAERFEPVLDPLPFAQWVEHGHGGRFPDADDVDYHLTTLFPPVRPRGWLELRMVDALPDPWWQVPVAVAAAVLGDDDAAAQVDRAAAPASGLWGAAARHALDHPVLHGAARACFDVAVEALAGGPDAELAALVAAYRDRYVTPGRCPADDRLDAWARHGGPLPALEAAR